MQIGPKWGAGRMRWEIIEFSYYNTDSVELRAEPNLPNRMRKIKGYGGQWRA